MIGILDRLGLMLHLKGLFKQSLGMFVTNVCVLVKEDMIFSIYLF